jgi:hypothetical protein
MSQPFHYINSDTHELMILFAPNHYVSATYLIRNQLPIFGRRFSSSSDLQQFLINKELGDV